MIGEPSQPKSRDNRRTKTGGRRPGTLYIVGVPIGSHQDITLRAIDILRHAAIVAAETPSITQELLSQYDIQATLTSYDPRNHHEKTAVLVQRLREGQDVALVSDTGMPVIYDPGRRLIAAARKAGLPVSVIPGPSALTAAVALSGYPGDRIVFEGRLPETRPQLFRFLARFKGEVGTAVFFVPPGHLLTVLESLTQILPTREVALAIDLSTPDEVFHKGRPAVLLKKISSWRREANATLVMQGSSRGKKKTGYRSTRRRAGG